MYAIIISGMLGKSVSNLFRRRNITNIVLAIGSGLFYFSDLMLALNMFTDVSDRIGIFCLMTYYIAQCMIASSILCYGNSQNNQHNESQVLDIYLPENDLADVFIYFHGGGLEAGDKVCGVQFQRLVDAGKIVISANYRMYPNAAYPDFLVDAAAVVHWAKENLGKYKKAVKIFVGGSSAGAYITAMLAYDSKYLGTYGIRTTDINGYIIDSAQMTTHFNVLRERGINPNRIIVDDAAPVYHIHENTEFPNALVLFADNDIPYRLEQNKMFLKTAEVFQCPKNKIRYKLLEGLIHCEYNRLELFVDMILEFMNTTGTIQREKC